MSVGTQNTTHAMVSTETYLGVSSAGVNMGPMEALGWMGDVSRVHPQVTSHRVHHIYSFCYKAMVVLVLSKVKFIQILINFVENTHQHYNVKLVSLNQQ